MARGSGKGMFTGVGAGGGGVGAGVVVKVNWSAGTVAEVAPDEITVTSTVPEPAGLMAVIEVAELTVKPAAGILPKLTAVTPVKSVPMMVTAVPPEIGPEFGLMPVTVGTAWVWKAPMSVAPFTVRGKPVPRWSLAKPFAAPLARAALPTGRASVGVGPPLLLGVKVVKPGDTSVLLLAPVMAVMPVVLPIRLKSAARVEPLSW